MNSHSTNNIKKSISQPQSTNLINQQHQNSYFFLKKRSKNTQKKGTKERVKENQDGGKPPFAVAEARLVLGHGGNGVVRMVGRAWGMGRD